MCGEIENEVPLEQHIVEHFRDQAERYLAGMHGGTDDSGDVAGAGASERYMDRLFAAILRRCVDDVEGDNATVDRLRAQAIVLARLSGLLAGQLPTEYDTLHATMDAMLVGYGEGQGSHAHGDDHHHHHHHH